MWGWASSRPQRCLKFGADSVAWAETERNWRGRRRYRCTVSPIPGGAVKLSSAEQNLFELPTLESRVRTLAGPSPELRIAGRTLVSGIPRPIVLLLPDASVRAAVLQFDALPSRADERDALIRWRLGQEQLFPLAGVRVVSQVFEGRGGSPAHAQTVLAVAIQESVLAQYESLCGLVGLIPQEIGVTSFRLFDLWLRTAGGSRWQNRDLLWMNLSDRALTVMMFQRGRLLFYRCKSVSGDVVQGVGKADTVEKIVEECGASLEACQQRHDTVSIKHAVLCAEGDMSGLEKRLEDELGLSVERLGWNSVESLGWITKGQNRSVASLSALAGVA